MNKKYKPPLNLRCLLKGDTEGYLLKVAYSLQLGHSLMGYFPAILCGSEKEGKDGRRIGRIIVTTDLKLIRKVWTTLSSEESKLDTDLYYVNEKHSIGYRIPQSVDSLDEIEPITLLTQAEFDDLVAKTPHPFKWVFGLIGGNINRKEFLRAIRIAIREASA